MISGIWLAGHVNWISRDGLEWVFGLNEHIRTGVCFGLNVLDGGRWFIHAGRPTLPLGTLTLDSSSGNVMHATPVL